MPFAEYSMPLQYETGIIKEHCHTRKAAGLFDISHMGQIQISGGNIPALLECLTPSNFSELAQNRLRYTVLTNDRGGIIDDCVVANHVSHWSIVANASRKRKVLEYLRLNLNGCDVLELSDWALLALQGPAAAGVLEAWEPKAGELPFMSSCPFSFDGIKVFVSRCGYTGEDGYELSVLGDQVDELARLLIAHELVEPIGLGARDSLRMEAGLCLYGHDIDGDTSPIEASLDWVVAAKYDLKKGKPAGFPGSKTILAQMQAGPARRRVGIKPEGRALVRENTELMTDSETVVGVVTSGGFGPTVKGPVAMGYVSTEYARPGTKLTAMVRNQPHSVSIVGLPFVPHRYYKR